MTFDYHKQPISATVPDVIYLLDQIKIASGTSYAAINLASVIFSTPIRKENQKQFIFM